MSDENDKIIAAEVIKEIEQIKRDLDEGIQSKDYGILEEKVKTSSQILDDLSHYCKEIVGPDRVLNMSLNVFIKDCISTWKKKFWSIEIIGQADGSMEIECSKIRLKRAFENLILNSMEAGSSEVLINIKKDCIEFVDDGKGISPEDAKVIKEKGTTKPHGSGMGLKMVKSLFTPLGFSLELKNNEDGGLAVILKKGA